MPFVTIDYLHTRYRMHFKQQFKLISPVINSEITPLTLNTWDHTLIR
jgi:hypothetical protein